MMPPAAVEAAKYHSMPWSLFGLEHLCLLGHHLPTLGPCHHSERPAAIPLAFEAPRLLVFESPPLLLPVQDRLNLDHKATESTMKVLVPLS